MTELILFCFTCKHFMYFNYDTETTHCHKYLFGAPQEILISKECTFWEDRFEDDEEDS